MHLQLSIAITSKIVRAFIEAILKLMLTVAPGFKDLLVAPASEARMPICACGIGAEPWACEAALSPELDPAVTERVLNAANVSISTQLELLELHSLL